MVRWRTTTRAVGRGGEEEEEGGREAARAFDGGGGGGAFAGVGGTCFGDDTSRRPTRGFEPSTSWYCMRCVCHAIVRRARGNGGGAAAAAWERTARGGVVGA